MERDDAREQISQRRRKRAKKRIITRVIAGAVIAAAALFAVLRLCTPGIVADGTVVEFEVQKGQSAKSIAEALKDEGLISSVNSFLRTLDKSEYSKSLKYGSFSIERGTDNDGIIAILAGGGRDKNAVTVTIPEGFSLEMIIARLVQSGLCDEASLKEAVLQDYDYDFLSCVPENKDIKYRLQGFLFPSTYDFQKGASAADIINTMLSEFEKQMKKAGISEKNLFETVTVASLVEREAKVDSERAAIAGVIENRLKDGMRLQIDATAVYAVSDGLYNLDRVLYKDIETDSPYNTYRISGLPAGPICSPGIKSLKAAANPEKHDYLYYRVDSAKSDGSHIFTKTFDEHKNAG